MKLKYHKEYLYIKIKLNKSKASFWKINLLDEQVQGKLGK